MRQLSVFSCPNCNTSRLFSFKLVHYKDSPQILQPHFLFTLKSQSSSVLTYYVRMHRAQPSSETQKTVGKKKKALPVLMFQELLGSMQKRHQRGCMLTFLSFTSVGPTFKRFELQQASRKKKNTELNVPSCRRVNILALRLPIFRFCFFCTQMHTLLFLHIRSTPGHYSILCDECSGLISTS